MPQHTPPIPASCAHRPTTGGLVAPYVNTRLRDGSVDFRTPHQATYERCWTDQLCQTCGNPLPDLAILFGGPRQLADRRFDEPPLCPPCAVYASKACPMVAGRMSHYADRQRISETTRGRVCPDPACNCAGLVPANPDTYDASGEPAHTWYAAYVRTGAWQLTGNQVRTACDLGPSCLHDRNLINGCMLTADPLKVIHVSEPGQGRIWKRHA